MASGFVVAPLAAVVDTRPPWARGRADDEVRRTPGATTESPRGGWSSAQAEPTRAEPKPGSSLAGGETRRGDLPAWSSREGGETRRDLPVRSSGEGGDTRRVDDIGSLSRGFPRRDRILNGPTRAERDEPLNLSAHPDEDRSPSPSTGGPESNIDLFVPDLPGGFARRRVVPRHPSLAALTVYLADPDVTDVFVNGAAGLFVDRGGGAERIAGWQADEDEVRALAVALIGLGGRHIDDASPCVDVRLDGGIRVHAVLPPVAPDGAAVSIRLPSTLEPSLDDLGRRGMFDDAVRARLDALVAERRNMLVSGATGSGKTTLLAALLAAAPPGERIVTIEDVAELRVAHPHHVRLEARQANLEGAGAVDLARLVREALRMRPDRLVVGECRGAEVRELLTALNTGHRGGAGTLHASSLADVPARLEALGALAGLRDRALARQAVSAIEVVLHLERGADGTRRIAAAGRPVLERGRLGIRDLGWQL